MRFSYLLLTAAVALLASDNVVSAYSNSQSTKAVDAAAPQELKPSGRLLRRIDSDEEERKNFSEAQLQKMLDDISYMTKKFEKWNREGYSYNDVVKYVTNAHLRNKYREHLGI